MIIAVFAIWLGASLAGQVMRARALRLLTSEQEAEVHRLSWDRYLFFRFLQLDLLIVFIATVLMWSGTAAIATVAFMAGLALATILRLLRDFCDRGRDEFRLFRDHHVRCVDDTAALAPC